MKKTMTVTDPYQLGYNDGYDGFYDNPFAENSDPWYDYEKGYDTGSEDYELDHPFDID